VNNGKGDEERREENAEGVERECGRGRRENGGRESRWK
jgi:hypothetical protein